MLVDMPRAPMTDDPELGRRMTEFATMDRCAHARTALLMEREARMSREAWGRSMDTSDLIRSEVMSLRTTVLGQQAVITELQATDRRRQGKMAPKRVMRSGPAPETTTTTTITNAQLKAMINQGITDALAAHDRNTNGDDSHVSGISSDKIERYVGGLPNMIHGSVVGSKPKTMQEAIEIATELMDTNISSLAEKDAENKRKFDDTSRNNQNQQLPPKRQNVARAYTAGSGDMKHYEGSKPLCPKSNYHNDGPCQKPTCYECGVQGHFKRECLKLRNNNRGRNALAKVYVVGNARTNPDSNVVTGTFLLNNCYASILFDTGADKSFVSTAFSSQIDITPIALDHFYDVKLADGRIIGVNTIIWGCTLNFLNHPFNINLMPIEMGSFDVIIGMDRLSIYQAVIICAEKIVRIP
ncbi:putative reverse transcriptase domain-containing protein [Tanacetum coccineum]|uniref:Reverse transcriptase domain-containing protein n=1 Tax=Tanacetum coccineum TaxID=301880 RepID=A0ABQ4ZIS1_9ASTR